MRNFFLNLNSGFKIEIFNIYHFFLILLTFLIILLIYYKRKNIQELSYSSQKRIRLVFAFILIINLILRRGSFIYYGVYDISNHLDIGFCNFTSLLFLTYALTGNKKLYSICYYMAFIGPLMSILCPSASLSLYNYSFYSFIVIHHLVFIFNFIFLYMEKLKFNWSSFKHTLIFLVIYFISIYFLDYLFVWKYNMPLEFLNDSLQVYSIIRFLSSNIVYEFLTMYSGITVLLAIALIILKKCND